MYKFDPSLLAFLSKTKELNKKQMKNIGELLKISNSYDKASFGAQARIVGVNVLGVGTELLVLQIVENLQRGFLLIALLGSRALFENFINIHYIFWHPQHEHDEKWADELSTDFFERSHNEKARKNQLGDTSLAKRAKETNWSHLYAAVYEDLSNYAHFLAKVTDSGHPMFFFLKTIETATYVTMMFQDSVMALASFLNCEGVKYYGNEVVQLKECADLVAKNIKKKYEKE